MRGSLTATRLLTLLLFLTLVAVCSFWALQILAPRPAIAPSASIGDTSTTANLTPAITLFGSRTATAGLPEASSNIQVSGVAEAGPNGVVILSVDGKPGVAYSVNETINEGTTVKSVGLDKVVLLQRGRLLELKAPDRASRDVLSSGNGKPRTSSESTAPPVSTRPVAPPPLPPAARAAPPQLQPPAPPQQQQLQSQQLQQHLQQQQQIQQQQQQQQVQQQQVQQQQQQFEQQQQLQQQGQQQPQQSPQQLQGQVNPQFQGMPGQAGSQAMQGAPQSGASLPATVSGQQQVAPGQQAVPQYQGVTGQPGIQ